MAEQKSAVVRVKLTFSAPDQPPVIEVARNSGSAAFADAVRERVLEYRVPCLQATATPLVVSQEFQFVAKHARMPVLWGPLRDDDWDNSPAARKCTERSASKDVVYPAESLRQGEQGNVLIRMRFSSVGTPPESSVVYDGGSARLGAAAKYVVDTYRMKCLRPDGEPMEATQTFKFRIEPVARREAHTYKLGEVLADVEDIHQQHVRFDFTQMGCPFELTFAPRQPYLDNAVGQVGTWNEDRREFVEWLRTLKLKIPEKSRPYIIGETLSVAVPCGELDLL